MVAALVLAAAFTLAGNPERAGTAQSFPVEEPAAPAVASRSRPAVPARAAATSALANVRVNDPSLLPAPAADITPAIAVNGAAVLVVWRVVGSLPTQRLRASYSTNGGVTFTDAGWLPNLVGDWRWGVDPSVVVDPFDGTFMVGAQAVNPSLGNTGIGFVTAHVAGGLTWGTPSIVHATGYVGALFGDQFHMHFDPTNFSLHMVFHDEYVPNQALIHRMSVDHGATWFAPDTIVSDPTGLTGASPRVAFLGGRGPLVLHNGATTWWAPATLRSSAFNWPAFSPPVNVGNYRYETGGLPGTLVDRVMNPALAVDRTYSLYENRAYAAWPAAANLSVWPTPSGGAIPEVEPNGTPATANALSPVSAHLYGTFSSSSDADVFSVGLLAQQHLVLVPEVIQAIGANAFVKVEVLAADGTHTLSWNAVLTTDVGAARLLFTAPRTATYFIRLTPFNTGDWMLAVSTSNLSASPATDKRDLLTSFSTDFGQTWSAPARVPVSPIGFDAGNVDVAVGNEGRPYLFWLDFSEGDPDGSLATLRATRSDDGGATWEAPRTISSVASDWQPVTVFGGSSIKIGYRLDAATTPIGLSESPRTGPQRATAYSPAEDMHVTWVDARDGEGNIYAAHFPTGFEVLFVQNDTTAAPGDWVGLRMVLQNRNPVFPEPVTPEFIACQRAHWGTIAAPFTIDPGVTTSLYPVVVQIPDTAAAGTVFYQAGIRAGGGYYGINTFIHVVKTSGVGSRGAALAFAPPAPSPARTGTQFHYALPGPREASLVVYDVTGARVRTLVTGTVGAGEHAQVWDLADDSGHRVAPGLYLARFTAGGWTRTQRVAVLR